jgi:hypothetical protein
LATLRVDQNFVILNALQDLNLKEHGAVLVLNVGSTTANNMFRCIAVPWFGFGTVHPRRKVGRMPGSTSPPFDRIYTDP